MDKTFKGKIHVCNCFFTPVGLTHHQLRVQTHLRIEKYSLFIHSVELTDFSLCMVLRSLDVSPFSHWVGFFGKINESGFFL